MRKLYLFRSSLNGIITSAVLGMPLAAQALSAEFDEIIEMLSTASISPECDISNINVSGETGARILTYEIKNKDLSMALSLREGARFAQWSVNRTTTGGVPYWRLAAVEPGLGLEEMQWDVRDSDLVSTQLNVRADDGRSLTCGAAELSN